MTTFVLGWMVVGYIHPLGGWVEMIGSVVLPGKETARLILSRCFWNNLSSDFSRIAFFYPTFLQGCLLSSFLCDLVSVLT